MNKETQSLLTAFYERAVKEQGFRIRSPRIEVSVLGLKAPCYVVLQVRWDYMGESFGSQFQVVGTIPDSDYRAIKWRPYFFKSNAFRPGYIADFLLDQTGEKWYFNFAALACKPAHFAPTVALIEAKVKEMDAFIQIEQAEVKEAEERKKGQEALKALEAKIDGNGRAALSDEAQDALSSMLTQIYQNSVWKTIDGVEFSKLSHRGDFVVVEIRSAPYFEALLVARIGYTIQWHPYYVRSGMFNGEVCRPIFFDDHKKQAAFDPTPTVAPEMYSRAIESIEAKILSLSNPKDI